MITYRKLKDKYIFNKDGVFISLTEKQIEEMKALFAEIDKEKNGTP